MCKRIRSVLALLPLFPVLGCADDHRVTGPDEAVVLDVLASTSSSTGYEVVRLTYPFQYPLFGIELQGSDVASWINKGNSMNDEGWITGRVGSGAATWDSKGVLRVLSIPEANELCHGSGINNTGDVVGSCWNAAWSWGSVPVFWDGSEGARPLSMEIGGKKYFRGSARAINDDKRIAGFLHTEDRGFFAVVWNSPEENPVLLPELDRLPDLRIGSYALGINSQGDIVGNSNNQASAWLLDGDNGYKAIALPHGAQEWGVEATSITNDRDIVAGWLAIEPYQTSWHDWRDLAPWQPGLLGNNSSRVRLWLYEGGESWVTVLPENFDYQGLIETADRKNGSLHVVGVDKGGARPTLWTFHSATGKMLDETRLPYPAGWHRNNSWCRVRAIDPQGLMAGTCREVKGNDYGIWEIIVWRPIGEPDPGDPGDPGDPDPGDPEDPPPGEDPVPVASFTYNCNNTATCNFTDTSTGTGLSWSWTFANAQPAGSSDQNPSATFKSAGTWAVKLTVTGHPEQSSDSETTVTCTVRGQLRCR